MRQKPDFWLRLFCYSLAVLGISGLLRMLAALRLAPWMQQFGATVSPLYLALTGGITFLGALVACIGLWTGQRWAGWFARGFILVYLLWYWLNRLLLTQTEAAAVNWLFAVLFSLYALLYTYFITRPAE